jgi:UDP-glucose 4-epimerase
MVPDTWRGDVSPFRGSCRRGRRASVGASVRCLALTLSQEQQGRALITGGAGFIGSHLAELLLADGWEVWVLDDLSTGVHGNVENLRERPGFHLVVDSILARAVVSELVHRVDVVYHLAAAVGVRLIVEQPVHTMVTNVQGTETVLEYCNKFGKRVLIASSSEVYGDHREERALREDDRRVYGPVTERRWLYADSKAMDEFLALGFHQERELDCVIARFFNTVGPRQQGQYGMVIPRFVERALAGEPLEVHGDGTQTRSFCHVLDAIQAVYGLMSAREISGEIFNVGSAERIRIIDLARRVLELTDSASELEFIPHEHVYGLGIEDVLHREPSIEKITAAIGWEPTLELDRILADVIADHDEAKPGERVAPPRTV